MVEVKNPFEVANADPETRHLRLWNTEYATYWLINSEPNVQDDMHYHDNDDHIFMVLEGEGVVRTPEHEYAVKPFDIILLTSKQPYQLCNTGKGRLLLLGAGNREANGKPRFRVPKNASHMSITEPIVA